MFSHGGWISNCPLVQYQYQHQCFMLRWTTLLCASVLCCCQLLGKRIINRDSKRAVKFLMPYCNIRSNGTPFGDGLRTNCRCLMTGRISDEFGKVHWNWICPAVRARITHMNAVVTRLKTFSNEIDFGIQQFPCHWEASKLLKLP